MILTVLSRLAVATISVFTTGAAIAGAYPDKPIRAIVPFVPGGGTDTAARIVLKKVSESMGQQIIIENKGGAGGTIGLAEVARSQPDGYTIGIGGTSVPLMSLIFGKLSFDPEKDLVSVAPLAAVPVVLIGSPKRAATTMRDIIAMGKSNPSAPMYFGTPGTATPQHLAGVLLGSTAGIPMSHVPYKGSAQAMQDVVGDHIPFAVVGLSTALPYARDGRVKIFGVGSAKRSPLAPEIPTLAEGGVKGFDASMWYDVEVPAATPRAILERLHSEITKAVQSPEVRDALMKAGFDPLVMSPAENQAALKADSAKWSKIIREYNIRAQ